MLLFIYLTGDLVSDCGSVYASGTCIVVVECSLFIPSGYCMLCKRVEWFVECYDSIIGMYVVVVFVECQCAASYNG